MKKKSKIFKKFSKDFMITTSLKKQFNKERMKPPISGSDKVFRDCIFAELSKGDIPSTTVKTERSHYSQTLGDPYINSINGLKSLVERREMLASKKTSFDDYSMEVVKIKAIENVRRDVLFLRSQNQDKGYKFTQKMLKMKDFENPEGIDYADLTRSLLKSDLVVSFKGLGSLYVREIIFSLMLLILLFDQFLFLSNFLV